MLQDTGRLVRREGDHGPGRLSGMSRRCLPSEALRATGDGGCLGDPHPAGVTGQRGRLSVLPACHGGDQQGRCGSGYLLGAHTILCTESIYRNGTEAQRRRYLPGPIDGSKIGALAITEPEPGLTPCHFAHGPRSGRPLGPQRQQDVHHQRPVADVVIVYAKTDPEAGPRGITTSWWRMDSPGSPRARS